MLEYLRDELRPDALVVALSGGNDFQGLMALDRFHHRRPAPSSGPHGGQALRQVSPIGPVAQVLVQTAHIPDDPADLSLATLNITREELGLTDERASHWLEFLAQRELSTVDMQPVFRAHALRGGELLLASPVHCTLSGSSYSSAHSRVD